MKLLFLTQILDRSDGILGFVPRWIEGLAHEVEAVRVIALAVGPNLGLPPNVDTIEIGREGRVRRFLRYHNALRTSLDEGFDTALAHMVPRYALLAAPWCRRSRAGLFLWYTHKAVDERLIRAERLVRKVFTASEESFRMDSRKRVVTGHGIDVAHFAPDPTSAPRHAAGARIELLAAGRMTPAKDPRTVVDALALLIERGIDARLTWAGGALAGGDDEFGQQIKNRVEQLELAGRVSWLGHVPYPAMPALYRGADVLVNSSHTGSVDKVVLEAMACGVAPLTCNESFESVFESLPDGGAAHTFEPRSAEALAGGILRLVGGGGASASELRDLVVREHEVDRLMKRLVHEMTPSRARAH